MNASLSKLKGILHAFKYGDRIHPVRDWLILLVTTLCILAVSFVWNIWLFARVTGGEPIGSATSTPAIGAPSIDSVQALFQKRSTEEARYQNEYRFVDPSI